MELAVTESQHRVQAEEPSGVWKRALVLGRQNGVSENPVRVRTM